MHPRLTPRRRMMHAGIPEQGGYRMRFFPGLVSRLDIASLCEAAAALETDNSSRCSEARLKMSFSARQQGGPE